MRREGDEIKDGLVRWNASEEKADTYVQDRAIAVRTAWAEEIVVVRLAVRVTVTLEEVARTELLVAVIAGEVLRMPGFA